MLRSRQRTEAGRVAAPLSRRQLMASLQSTLSMRVRLPTRSASTAAGVRTTVLLVALALGIRRLPAQEVRGIALLETDGAAVWGATISLRDSLGREAASSRSNRRGEFSVRAPVPGTYWLTLSARPVGRTASPVFVLDSGATLHYEHVFRRTLRERVRGEDFSAQGLLAERFRDSTAGSIERGVSTTPLRQVRVQVLDARNEAPVAGADVVLIAIDSRFEQVVPGATDSTGTGGWRDVQQTWYRVVARRLGFTPGGTESFPIVGTSDSVSITLRLGIITMLDPVLVMEQRLNAFGFNLSLMGRYFLAGEALRERNPSARNIDDLIASLRIPGLGIQTMNIESRMSYRGQRVRVFILDGSRINGDLPLIEPTSIESLMYIPPNEAGAIFGPDAIGGALIINTRQR